LNKLSTLNIVLRARRILLFLLPDCLVLPLEDEEDGYPLLLLLLLFLDLVQYKLIVLRIT